MTAKKLRIKDATRYPILEEQDALKFKPGVNVIVGDLQAGKSTWLRMIDYVLGDAGKVDEAFDAALSEKYENIVVTLAIGDEEIVIERRWKEAGSKTKMLVNGERMNASQFSAFLLERLGIPLIHIPSGNPYERSWVELSWRELFRHLYKPERMWGGFAEKQPDVNRSACILQLLGAAANLYPDQIGTMVAKKKERDRLETQKVVFVGVMQEVTVDLVGQQDMSVAVTPESVANSKERLNGRLAAIASERAAILNDFDQKRAANTTPAFDQARAALKVLYGELGKSEAEHNDTVRRHAELVAYLNTLTTELHRLARVKAAALVFADLKVTHCPACDQEIPERAKSPDQCAVCGQYHRPSVGDDVGGARRIEFEQQQVVEEQEELTKLIAELDQEQKAFAIQIANIRHRINAETQAVAAAQSLADRAIPPEIALLDQEAGKISEQIQQLDRISRVIGSREEMNSKIGVLDGEIATLDKEIKELTPTVDFEALSDLIADRMNDYLNLVNADKLSRWKTGRVSVKLRPNDFDVFLDGQRWSVKAGGTASNIIQIAYHYALLSLAKDEQYNHPGFLIIDFPPHFSNADDLRDSENYLLKPFVDLCAKPKMAGSQVLVAGRAFDNLEGANVIRL